MTQDILVILHSETSTPGRIGHMLVEKGYRLDIRKPCLGEDLPATMENHAGAVLFGGPMSANDSDDWIAREIDWMLSKQLGGSVGPHADGLVEIGYYPLIPTAAGEGLGPWPEHVYHWHREGLTLPRGAERIATGATFENQAFRYGAKAFGIQFHPEVTRHTMHRWAVLGAHRFAMPGAQHGKAHLDANLVHDGPVKLWLSGFLDRWLAVEAHVSH